MTEQEFREKYETDKPIFEKWGEYVSERIFSALKSDGIEPYKMLKIVSSPRVKDTESIIAKAFYRGKKYKDPYNEITDKVGMRFVALLEEDINKICHIIESIECWSFSKDRDYEKERENEPLTFDYQSMHFVVSSKNDIEYCDVIIPGGTPCEIQVRTLLQHAYSELTHDRVYKSNFDPTGGIKRTVARSMAFLETTDEYFQKVSDGMSKLPVFQLYELLKHKMTVTIGYFPDATKTNIHILQFYLEKINTAEFKNPDMFNDFDEIVKSNQSATFLNSQPVIYFIYFMCNYYKAEAVSKWGLTREELHPYFVQLGISMPHID